MSNANDYEDECARKSASCVGVTAEQKRACNTLEIGVDKKFIVNLKYRTLVLITIILSIIITMKRKYG